MKRIIFLSSILVCLVSVSITAQELISNSSLTGVCYAGNKITRIYIPPPKAFKEKSGAKGGVSIKVFYTGFTAEAKAAVEYAKAILEAMLPSGTNLTVNASWKKISTSGVLGSSSSTSYVGGWGIDALEPFAFYPISLAEKIAGKSLNEDSEGDISLTLNSSTNWYFGTDGNTPVQKYDLVTVVLHELCHGLGFFDSMDVQGSLGSYGLGSIPIIYDNFVENLNEKRLTDTLIFRQNSSSLYLELVGGELYFNGPLVKRYLSGSRARLYSPSTWDPGSSVSHLDEVRTLAVNSLMTPFIDFGEAIHDPGKLTFSVLGELGWINTRILHTPKKDTEEHLTQLEIATRIKSDTLYDRNSIGLVYSFNNFLTSDTLMMVSPSSDDFYTRSVAIPSYNVRLNYYLFAKDDFLRLYRSPSVAEKRPYSIFIGTDTVKPVISHTPTEFYFEKIDSILFKANITDNLGIDTVYVEYKVNNGITKYLGLTSGSADEYSKTLIAKHELLVGGDSIRYRIVAFDKAAIPNVRMLPSNGFFSIKIEGLKSTVTNYSTDFSNAANDFFNSGFEITKPLNFNSSALHTKHPYASPDQDNKSFDFVSILRHPVIFNASGMVISFREIVLVEPGAEGSVFGFSDFFDYVIVEGSKDFGKNWFSLADGYDSRINSSWLTAYNSSADGQNSTYKGKESMMLKHVFYPRIPDKISSGDSVLIRFRLYSDPYAHGWGWVIEDLQINSLVDPVEKINSDMVRVFPNPGNGLITINTSERMINSKPFLVSVYNSSGVCIINNKSVVDSEMVVDISRYSSGLYIIVVNNGARIRTVKYSLIK